MVAAPSFALPALYQLQQHPLQSFKDAPQPRKAGNNDEEEAEFAKFLSAFVSDESEDDLLLPSSASGGRPDNNNHDPALDLAPLVAAHLAAGDHGAADVMTTAGAPSAPCCGPRPAVPAPASAAAAAAAALASADDPLLLLHSAPSCGHEAARDANDLSGLFDAAAAEAATAAAQHAAWAVAAAAAANAPPPPAPLPLMTALPPMPTATMAPPPQAPQTRDDDCDSVATLPMPHKKRRRGSSPGPAGSQDANNAPNGDGAVDSRPSAASGRSPRRRFSAAAGRAATATPTPPPIPAPTPGAAVRAVLVAKVLTRSDATSKRIILPRVAIEANLAPQLASPSRPGASLVGTTFEFLARDATPSAANGQVPPAEPKAWPMVIKAWANGSNPKPVYVLEQVAPLLAARRLGVGDAVGILADRAGNFFVACNTAEVRAAAARPTCAAFTFAQADAAEAAAAAAEAPVAEEAEEAAAAPAAPEPAAAAEPAEPAAAPVMMMVAGGDAPSASVGRALFLSLDEADAVQPAAAAPAAPAVEVVPPSAPGAAPTLHVAGQLVCARTTGCKRPAGHQGWCYCK